jgi:hypothetical protein
MAYISCDGAVLARLKKENVSMKSGRSLQDLVIELDRQATRKSDFAAPTSKLSVEVVEGVVEEGRSRLALVAEGVGSFPLRTIAIDQTAGHLDIPLKYVRKLQDEQPNLLVQNFNTLLHVKPVRRLIRTLDGDARAFLSDRYQRIDNIDVAQVVLAAFVDTNLQVVSCEVTESRLYIKAVFPGLQREIKSRRVGDFVEAGVIVTNSEIGLGAVSVKPFAHFLVCTNGMVVNKAKRFTHVGARIGGEEIGYLKDDTIAAGDRFDLLRIRDALKQAIDETAFDEFVQQLEGATQQQIEAGRVTDAIEVLGNKLTFTEPERKSILTHLIEGGDLSRYGLVNAVTRTAQDAEGYDRATELEAAGYAVLALPANDWKQIAYAAPKAA